MPLIERDLTGDTCDVADATVASSNYVRSLGADAVVVTDLFARHPLFGRALVDVVVVADSIRTTTPHVVLIDTVLLIDTIMLELFVQHVRSITDTTDVTDSLGVVLSSFDVRLSDEITLVDGIVIDFTFGYPNRFMFDQCEVSDSIVAGCVYGVVLSADTIGVSDSIAGGLDAAVVIADTVEVTDQLVRAHVAHRPRLDAVGFTDFLTATVPELADRNPFNRAPGYL